MLATLVGLSVAVFAALVAARGVVYAVLRHRRTRRTRYPLVVVGTGPTGLRLVEGFRDRDDLGLVPVGVVHHGDPDAKQTRHAASLPAPALGGITTLSWAMLDLGVHDVAFAFPGPPDERGIAEVHRCLREGHRVLLSSDSLDLAPSERRRARLVVGGVPLVAMAEWGPPPWLRLLRRAGDVTGSLAGLLLLAPLLALIALLLPFETHSSTLQRSHRTSRAGRHYVRLTFRTLRPPEFAAGSTVWRIDNSSRTGRLGSLVRRTRLDDLPRLVNVLAGEESLFPSTPDRPRFAGELSDPGDEQAGAGPFDHGPPVLTDPAANPPVAGTPSRAPAPR